jgi:hypothetical protein
MSTVTLPRAGITPIAYVDKEGRAWVDQEWARAFNDLLIRVGGTTSNTISEINIAAFEDAGIAEQQAEIYTIDQTHSQHPPVVVLPPADDVSSIAELRSRVDALETAIQALRQGSTP